VARKHDGIDGAIEAAETACWKLCDQCGTDRDVTTIGGGWIRTMCSPCLTEWSKRSKWP